jgi:hypothetical protein
MHTSIQQCKHLLAQASVVFARLHDSHRALEPQPGAKTAGWLVGHLAVTGDFARHLCGSPPLCPREWRSAFNPGSRPSHDPADYPPMAVLCETASSIYAELPTLASTADAARLSMPNPYESARAAFPTAGDFVAYLMSSHLAYHLGQLTAWYAAAQFHPTTVE